MKIGIYGGNVRRGSGILQVVDDAVAAEAAGFASYWFPQVGTFDALTVIAVAGQQTRRIEFGTAVVPTFPRHPNALAQQAATANAFAGGRLVLGVGPSHKPSVERLGLRYERIARHVREYVTVLQALAGSGQVDFHGDIYNITTGFQVPGATPFPIVVSALAPLMLKAAGEVADGTVTWMVGPRTLEESVAPRINAAAKAAGRPAPRVVVALPVAVCDDVDQARNRAVQTFRGYGQLPNYRRQLDHEGLKEAGEIAIVGNEKVVETRIRALFAGGATEVVASVLPVGDDARASVARTTELLRGLAAA